MWSYSIKCDKLHFYATILLKKPEKFAMYSPVVICLYRFPKYDAYLKVKLFEKCNYKFCLFRVKKKKFL